MSKGAEDDHHPDHQDAVLKYNVRTGPGLRPYWFIRDQTPKDEKDRPEHYRMGRGYGPMVDVNVRLRSARPTEGEVTPSFSLDETSFKLVTERCSTSLSTADFYGPMTEENRHKYYDEMRSLLSRELGTPFVRIMRPLQVKNQCRNQVKRAASTAARTKRAKGAFARVDQNV